VNLFSIRQSNGLDDGVSVLKGGGEKTSGLFFSPLHWDRHWGPPRFLEMDAGSKTAEAWSWPLTSI